MTRGDLTKHLPIASVACEAKATQIKEDQERSLLESSMTHDRCNREPITSSGHLRNASWGNFVLSSAFKFARVCLQIGDDDDNDNDDHDELLRLNIPHCSTWRLRHREPSEDVHVSKNRVTKKAQRLSPRKILTENDQGEFSKLSNSSLNDHLLRNCKM